MTQPQLSTRFAAAPSSGEADPRSLHGAGTAKQEMPNQRRALLDGLVLAVGPSAVG